MIARRQGAVSTAIQQARDRQASALALHLDCSRAYIGKLEAEGVIQRQGGSFPLDQSRVAYLRYLRREHRQSPRAMSMNYSTRCAACGGASISADGRYVAFSSNASNLVAGDTRPLPPPPAGLPLASVVMQAIAPVCMLCE